MTGYTKLFASILDSSVWQEDSDTRCVWITLLAMAGAAGIVEASVPGIAHRARVPLETCERALARFQEPDRYSRSQEQDGRRIVSVAGGFQLVNHRQYRHKLSQEERRAYNRQWMADRRTMNPRSPQKSTVDTCVASGDMQIQKQIQKQTEQEISSEAPAAPSEPPVLSFPCVGHRLTYDLTAKQVAQWSEAFPHTDVMGECRKAQAWLHANQSNRKTARGMPRFLVSWLTRAVDSRSGADRRQQPRAASNYRPSEHADYDHWRDDCHRDHGGECSNYNAHTIRNARTA